jgi:hypothetical protein
MEKSLLLPRGRMGCLVALVIVLLAISAMIASANYFQYSHATCVNSTGDRLGGGFPFLLICDDWGGGSPTNSWGKIDGADVFNGGVQPLGCLGNLLFYTFLFSLPFAVGRGIFNRRSRSRNLP